MARAKFLFHGELAAFLAPGRRGLQFDYAAARAATLKNAIEALGVPHTEAALVLVNGERATLARILREGDALEVFPWSAAGEPDALPPGFVADAHLGGLARFLRMLGFDTVHHNRLADAEIRRLAEEERRAVLSRDRELMKCREVTRGCYVRATRPEAQLREVAERYALARHARPFTLCLHCNVLLEAADQADVASRVPARVAAQHARFTRCPGCGRVYWPGTHYERMLAALGDALAPGT
jgi:uncharacterized protein